jgi:transcriptional regulator with GAF, ATPase, and Fis domain
MATASESIRPFHQRMAELHRRIELRHLTAARMHDTHVSRLLRWAVATDRQVNRPPRYISAVAEMLGVRSAAITLLSPQQTEMSVISSDTVAAAAQDLEFALGEGPVHDATSVGEVVVVAADSLPHRWQHYSPAVSELGVRSLAVVPLGLPQTCLGALAVFDPLRAKVAGWLAETLQELADALTHTVLLTEECLAVLTEEAAAVTGPAAAVLGGADHQAVIHQAAGMVSAQCGCSVEDALALVKARAFVRSERVDRIARQIVEKRLRLDDQ